MTIFTFYLHEDDEKSPAFEIAMFDTLAQALDHGRRLLAERPRYTFVEVTSEETSLATLTRETAAAFSTSRAERGGGGNAVSA
jgi:hypothetical protein